MKTLTFNDTQLESLKTMISYNIDNEQDHFNECLENDYKVFINDHIYAHALKLKEVLDNA